MPINRRLALFSLGVSFWFLAIGGIGLIHAYHAIELLGIVICLTLAHVLLFLFTRSLTRSLTDPIDSISRQIRSLTESDPDTLGEVDISSKDEIGELAGRINRLQESLRDVSRFKRVIEEDDSTREVYQRLSGVLTDLGLPYHQIYQTTGETHEMRLAVSTDDSQDWCNPVVLADCGQCRAIKTGAVVSSTTYPRICQQFSRPNHEHICTPLIIDGSAAGVVQVIEPFGPGRAVDLEIRLEQAQRYIREAIPVLAAKRISEGLRESSVRDNLTQVYNRRFLEEIEASMIALARRRMTPLGLAMCDVDHLGRINDTYGHDVGDQILSELANVLQQSVRACDIMVRYGGEEFLIVLQEGAQDDGILTAADRSRAAVEEHSFQVGDTVIRCTISVGVAEFPTDACTLAECIERADEALYVAKESGRNRVVRYPATAVSPVTTPETEPPTAREPRPDGSDGTKDVMPADSLPAGETDREPGCEAPEEATSLDSVLDAGAALEAEFAAAEAAVSAGEMTDEEALAAELAAVEAAALADATAPVDAVPDPTLPGEDLEMREATPPPSG
jgi:diguanylate cyclase (GGDEF)-like protein